MGREATGGARGKVRHPAVAGTFYARDPGPLHRQVLDCFRPPRGPGGLHTPPNGREGPGKPLVAGVVPHAGLVYSGPIAAHFYHLLGAEPLHPTVLLFGVNHHALGSLFSVTDEDWRTPLGVVRTDASLVEDLVGGPIELDPLAQRAEHSIEVQLPFLQVLYPQGGFSIVALQVTFADFAELRALGQHVARVVRGRDVLLVASTDLTHYLPVEEANRWDSMALAALETLSARRLYDTVVENRISMCGIAPTTALLATLEGSEHRAQLLSRGTSADAEPMDQVVGYASLAIR